MRRWLRGGMRACSTGKGWRDAWIPPFSLLLMIAWGGMEHSVTTVVACVPARLDAKSPVWSPLNLLDAEPVGAGGMDTELEVVDTDAEPSSPARMWELTGAEAANAEPELTGVVGAWGLW